MKILFCTNVFEIIENGPVKFAHLILQINALYPAHELHILTEDIQTPRPNVHKVKLPTFWKKSPVSQFIRMWAYHREAMRIRARFPFDVLVYNHALVGLWSAYRFERTIGMINDDNNAIAAVRQEKSLFIRIKRWLFHQSEKLMAKRAPAIIVNSDYLKTTLEKAYRLPAHKVHRLYKAVELPLVEGPSPKKISPSEPIQILFVKNDYVRGGLFTLLEALSLLPFRFTLTLIGPNQSDKERIMNRVATISNVEGHFLGKIPQADVQRLLANTHLFCVPSQKEALGVANLEAMAQGVPVVSTWVGGIPEVLDYGRCGWLVEPNNAVALAAAIEECLTQETIRTQKIVHAYQQVQNFSPYRMFDTFLEILSL
ncbi:glycosyltransferase family 4 protein [Arundinibacter roseus]|uniref:Glycosyltransferase family 1 protein n=1 Tax=Arundinibacter roseus TaxID=2070510 RepID=A0A4R4K7B4_9BACT|nr:glycosyltransferase family 4 protein [Arundinibacter roseus]TDB63477.1 glycosyltransferase family 1 protein [Arundinibacter roseus]